MPSSMKSSQSDAWMVALDAFVPSAANFRNESPIPVRQKRSVFYQSTPEAQPQLPAALVRLSAISSQDFIASLPFSTPDEFPTPRNLSVFFSGLNDRQARDQYRKMLCPSP